MSTETPGRLWDARRGRHVVVADEDGLRQVVALADALAELTRTDLAAAYLAGARAVACVHLGYTLAGQPADEQSASS